MNPGQDIIVLHTLVLPVLIKLIKFNKLFHYPAAGLGLDLAMAVFKGTDKRFLADIH